MAPVEVIKGEKTSRQEWMTKRNQPISFPDVHEGKHLIDWIKELGFATPVQGGMNSLSYQEIKAWSDLTEIDLRYDEVVLLKRLSSAFCGQYNGSDIKDKPPYINTEFSDKVAQGACFLAILDGVNDVAKLK